MDKITPIGGSMLSFKEVLTKGVNVLVPDLVEGDGKVLSHFPR